MKSCIKTALCTFRKSQRLNFIKYIFLRARKSNFSRFKGCLGLCNVLRIVVRYSLLIDIDSNILTVLVLLAAAATPFNHIAKAVTD